MTEIERLMISLGVEAERERLEHPERWRTKRRAVGIWDNAAIVAFTAIVTAILVKGFTREVVSSVLDIVSGSVVTLLLIYLYPPEVRTIHKRRRGV